MSSAFPLPTVSRWDVRDRRTDETMRLARLSTLAPRIPWDRFLTNVFVWQPGEHVAMIGPTGLGKTTMLLNILPIHPFVVVFATKPRDKTMDGLIRAGYLKLERWQSIDPNQFPRRVLWPDATRLNSSEHQRVVFHDAFDKIYREGHWTVALDETWYMDNVLNLGSDIKTYLLQARSLGISLAAATQRPAWVPRELYTSSTHIMFWRTNDETDLRSLSGIGWRSADLIRDTVSNLDLYQVLYINTRTGFMCRTRCPDIRV